MGLDMYAFSVPAGTGTDFEIPEGSPRSEVAYWRKFNALHGFMEELAREKGFQGEFNCVPVRLTLEDLNELEYAVKNKTLQPVDGFFFGSQTIDESDIESVADFLSEAREEIASGMDVYYDSWW